MFVFPLLPAGGADPLWARAPGTTIGESQHWSRTSTARPSIAWTDYLSETSRPALGSTFSRPVTLWGSPRPKTSVPSHPGDRRSPGSGYTLHRAGLNPSKGSKLRPSRLVSKPPTWSSPVRSGPLRVSRTARTGILGKSCHLRATLKAYPQATDWIIGSCARAAMRVTTGVHINIKTAVFSSEFWP